MAGSPREDDQGEFERTLADVSLPDVVSGFSARRVDLVARAAREWVASLIDLGGRNNLLCYRDLRSGTLDLTQAAPEALQRLLAGGPVRSSALFPGKEERPSQLRRLRTIHNKARENLEERGVQTLSLACGLGTWENQRGAGWTPCAPVLLRHASLRALGAAQDEFELELVDEMEVNPTLLHLLKVDFDCEVSQDTLLERVDGVIDETWELQETYSWLMEHASRVPGFAIEPRLVLANFAYAKLSMVKDIEASFDGLVAHELIAAIAGDEEARQAVRDRGPGPDAVPSPDSIRLGDEFLVLDADSSQNYAITAATGGSNLIVRGPPGTGKSQTIANLIASLVARDKKVLFVAEKRAAIDAVLKRLAQRELNELVLDLHGGTGSRRAFAERIGKSLLANRSVPRTNGTALHERVETNREHLNAYVDALHRKRVPWELSVYEMRSDLLGLGGPISELRFTADELQRLGADVISEAQATLQDFARLGGLTIRTGSSPWRTAEIRSAEQAQAALMSVEELRRKTLPSALVVVRAAAERTGVPAPNTLADWSSLLELWGQLSRTHERLAPSIYEEDLDELGARMAPASTGGFARMKASMTSSDYKAARRVLRGHLNPGCKCSDLELLAHAREASVQLARWRELGGTGTPQTPIDGDLDDLPTDFVNV